MEDRFAAGVATGLSPTAAAAEAGYSDPSGEVDRLLSRRRVLDAVLDKARPVLVRWRTLSEAAKRTLHDAMETSLDARSGGPRWSDRIAAAKVVMDTLRRIGKGERALADVAETEDTADDTAALAKRILGSGTTTEQ